MKKIIDVVIFTMIGVLLLCTCSQILVKKWVEPNTYGIVRDIYSLESETVDAVFLGTSHMECGVSPMDIYINGSVVSYNLATPGQPIEISYYLLAEFFKNQSPKVAILDVSNLFHNMVDATYWKLALDGMKFGKNKIDCAKAYETSEKIIGETNMWETLVPIYGYHTRWKNLSEEDFEFSKPESFMYGYYMVSYSSPATLTVDEMNDIAYDLQNVKNNSLEVHQFTANEENIYYNAETAIEYTSEISSINMEYLLKLKEICEENDCKLILTKIPSVSDPGAYIGAWTKDKYEKVEQIAEGIDISFIDILYDENVTLDWATDSYDNGAHLNYLGAQKVSNFFSKYLSEECGIEGKSVNSYDEKVEKYNRCIDIAIVQNKESLLDYLSLLYGSKNKIVLLAGSSGSINNLTYEEKNMLKKLGANIDFSQGLEGESYLGVFNDKYSEYEAYSKTSIMYSYSYGENTFVLICDGIDNSNFPAIMINNEVVSMARKGLNIVVYDKDTESIIDSVSFQMSENGGNAYRNYTIDNYLNSYIENIR